MRLSFKSASGTKVDVPKSRVLGSLPRPFHFTGQYPQGIEVLDNMAGRREDIYMKRKIPIYHLRRVRRDNRQVESLGYFGSLDSLRTEAARVSKIYALKGHKSWSKRLDNRQTAATERFIYVSVRTWLRDPEVVLLEG